MFIFYHTLEVSVSDTLLSILSYIVTSAIKFSKALLDALFLLGQLLPLWQIQFHPRYHIDHKELNNTKSGVGKWEKFKENLEVCEKGQDVCAWKGGCKWLRLRPGRVRMERWLQVFKTMSMMLLHKQVI